MNHKYSPEERYRYLQQLVTEFQDTSSTDAKEQVLANLANFAYDPINFEHFRKLNVVSLFLDHLDDENENLVECAVSGICNMVLDGSYRQLILSNGGVGKVLRCLSSSREETVLSAITTLIFMVTPESKAEITAVPIVECMDRFSRSSSRRLRNLATVFVEDYCTPAQLQEARNTFANVQSQNTTVNNP